MANYTAVYNTNTFQLLSVASDPSLVGVLPVGLAEKTTTFSDSTPSGSNPQNYVWNPATLNFDPRPAPTPTTGQAAADALIAKAGSTWTNTDVANALRLLLAFARSQLQ